MSSRLPPEELLAVIRISQAERRAEAHPRVEPDRRPGPNATSQIPLVTPLGSPAREPGTRWSRAVRS